VPVPADISNPGFDVLGSPLDYSGRVPMNAALTASPCGTFDAVDDSVNVADHADFDITDHMSVSIRAKHATGAVDGTDVVVAKYDFGTSGREWILHFKSNEKLYVALGAAGGGSVAVEWGSDSAIDLSGWVTLGFTFASGTLVMYLNGASIPFSVISGSAPSTLNNGAAALSVGSSLNSGSPANPWDGSLCDMQLWSGTGAVLSAAQMLSLHNGNTITDANQAQVLWLPIAEYSGITAYDLGADATARHNGTINNATTTKGAGFWAQTQDAVHHLARYGGTLSGDVFIPGDPFNAGLDAAGDPLGLQPYKTHEPNLIDFTNGVLAPGTATWETAYVFDAARTNPLFVRDIKSGGVTAASDRLLAYGTALAGDDLTNANEYTADA
jgi:hypothetical protein